MHVVSVFLASVWFPAGTTLGYSGGMGTVAAPYEIASKADLLHLRSTLAHYDKHFILTADIDMSGNVYPAALIGPDTTSAANFSGIAFRGTLDGQNHSISNLTIDTADAAYNYLGLFGRIGPGAQVSNLKLENFSITQTTWSKCFGALAGDITKAAQVHRCKVVNAAINAPSKAGLLVGESAGLISNCHVSGTLTGHTACGGLLGNLLPDDDTNDAYDMLVEYCSSAGLISGTTQLGGLVGSTRQFSKVSECVSSMQINAGANAQKIGGLVGELSGGFIVNSHAAGDVTVGDNARKVGGFIGQSSPDLGYPGVIMLTYCRNTVSCGPGSAEVGAYAGANLGSALYYNYYLSPADWNLNNGLAASLSDAQMQDPASFANWNFETTWAMDPYPILAWEKPVGFSQFSTLASFWRQTGCYGDELCADADWYTDGVIDEKDLLQLARSWLGYGIDTVSPTYFDGFETGDFSALPWTTPQGAPWTITSNSPFDGAWSAYAGTTGSALELTVYCPENYLISFQYKVSTYSFLLDYVALGFYIDGNYNNEWKGEYPWAQHSVNVSPGVHTFKWSLFRTAFAPDTGSAWIDNVKLQKLN
jgi:hypothetical protein